MKTAKLVSAVLIAMTAAACATEEDLSIEPACEGDDAKCDAASSQGFEIFKGADGKYYFHMVSGNGAIVLRSQAYSSKSAATKGVESVRANGVDPENFRVLEAANGEFYVNLYAANGEVIATSETYARKYNAKRAIDTSVGLVAEAQHIRAAKSGARFQTLIGADHQAYFHLRGKNGEVMLVSEGYLNAASAIKGIASVRTSGKVASNYTIKTAADGQYYFTLEAANHEVIGHGETYASKSNAQRAVDTMVALLKSELVADPAAKKAPARSLADQTDLVKALGALSDIAAGGDQLSYFGFAEQAAKPAGVSCEDATADQISQAYDGLIEEVQLSGDASKRPDLTQSLIDSSKAQLTVLLGTDSYELCTHALEGQGISGAETFILSKSATGPKIVLELGYDE